MDNVLKEKLKDARIFRASFLLSLMLSGSLFMRFPTLLAMLVPVDRDRRWF